MTKGLPDSMPGRFNRKGPSFFKTVQDLFSENRIQVGFYDTGRRPLAPSPFLDNIVPLIPPENHGEEPVIRQDGRHYYFVKLLRVNDCRTETPGGNRPRDGIPGEFYIVARMDRESAGLKMLFSLMDLLVRLSVKSVEDQCDAGGVFQNALYQSLRELNDAREREKRTRLVFQRYVPGKVASEILYGEDKDFLKGRESEVTILFTDIRGFTAIAETHPQEEIVSMLNGYFSFMIDIVLENGGDVYKFMGDGMMAVFDGGAENARRALVTALNIKKGLDAFNRERNGRGLFEIGMGIGIHTGKVLVGNIGNEKRSDYTLIGDAVNIASRLEELTRKYNSFLVVTDTAFKLIRDTVIARELDSIRVKGRASPLVVYDILGFEQEMSGDLVQALREYNQGLIQYRIKQWEGAIIHFKKVLHYLKNDGPSLIYIERCSRYTFAPPPGDWDGIINSDYDENGF